MPPNNEIVFEAGTHLASLISAAFPDADIVRTVVARVLGVVEQYGLVGKWVIAVMRAGHEELLIGLPSG